MTPEWDLTSIYSSLESEEYKNDILTMQELLKLRSQLIVSEQIQQDFCSWLNDWLKSSNELYAIQKTITAYAYALYSTDTTNSVYMNNLTQSEKYILEGTESELSFSKILLENKNKLPEFYKKFPEYKEYDFLLQQIIEQTKHQMSPELEKLAGELNQTGGNAWSILQEQILSTLKDDDGNEFNAIRAKASSANPEERKKFWQVEKNLLEQNKIPLAACLNNLKGQTVSLNKRRNWNSAIENSLNQSRCSKKTLDALIQAINQTLPEWQKYFKAKAKYLRNNNLTASETAGTENNPGLAFYDLFAPLTLSAGELNKSGDSSINSNPTDKNWTFDEAINFVAENYSDFSEEMGQFVIEAKNKNWIDAAIHSGKVGGAYDEDFPKEHQSRVLVNFTGCFDDVVTLAHELGHAYHFSCLKNKPAMFYNYPMTLAETASTFGETIVKQKVLNSLSPNQKLSALDKDLQDVAQVLIDILSRYYFEESVFAEREKSELTAQDFCRLMADAQNRTYGPGLNQERHEYMWAVKGHYYISDFDFYNYPYAFGQLFASALYNQAKKSGKAFAETYKQILSQTGNLSCEELCQRAGFDITKKEFWLDAMKIYLDEINQFVQLI